MPGPVKEHELLQKFVGEWESEGEAFMAPGQPPTKLKGVESSRLIGGFWFVAQIKSTVPDFPYEPKKCDLIGRSSLQGSGSKLELWKSLLGFSCLQRLSVCLA